MSGTAEVTFTMAEFRLKMGIPQSVSDLWMDAYGTKVVVTVDPDRTRQPIHWEGPHYNDRHKPGVLPDTVVR